MTLPSTLIAGNWKMHGTVASSKTLVSGIAQHLERKPTKAGVVVCPPTTLLSPVGHMLEGSAVMLGAQDCHETTEGAHTGDTSVLSLKEFGAQYVIVGHSERRQQHGETSTLVARKAKTVIQAGLVPIICIGETLEEREQGRMETVIREQILASLPENISVDNSVIAYEPVWAIGTGKTATLEQIAEAHRFIKQQAKGMKVLYGGSVKAENAREILALDDVNGVLVGGASLNLQDFCAIIDAAAVKVRVAV